MIILIFKDVLVKEIPLGNQFQFYSDCGEYTNYALFCTAVLLLRSLALSCPVKFFTSNSPKKKGYLVNPWISFHPSVGTKSKHCPLMFLNGSSYHLPPCPRLPPCPNAFTAGIIIKFRAFSDSIWRKSGATVWTKLIPAGNLVSTHQ